MSTHRPHHLKTLVLLAVVGLLGGFLGIVGSLDAQEPKMLFTLVDMSNMELSEKEAKILDRVRKAPTTIDVKVLNLQDEALKEGGNKLSIPLSKSESMHITNYKFTKDDGVAHLNWEEMTLVILSQSRLGANPSQV